MDKGARRVIIQNAACAYLDLISHLRHTYTYNICILDWGNLFSSCMCVQIQQGEEKGKTFLLSFLVWSFHNLPLFKLEWKLN